MQGVRRVVTSHDADGKAIVSIDDRCPHKAERQGYSTAWRIWVTDQTPADMTGGADRGATPIRILPPAGGSAFRIAEFPPYPEDAANLPKNYFENSIGGEQLRSPRARPSSHPMMHRTKTIDYAVIVTGEIYMILDEQEVLLKAGDVVVQQGTNHAWENRSNDVCRIAFIIIDGHDPLISENPAAQWKS